MHQPVPLALSQWWHVWMPRALAATTCVEPHEHISICLSEQFSVTTVFLAALTAAPAVATLVGLLSGA